MLIPSQFSMDLHRWPPWAKIITNHEKHHASLTLQKPRKNLL